MREERRGCPRPQFGPGSQRALGNCRDPRTKAMRKKGTRLDIASSVGERTRRLVLSLEKPTGAGAWSTFAFKLLRGPKGFCFFFFFKNEQTKQNSAALRQKVLMSNRRPKLEVAALIDPTQDGREEPRNFQNSVKLSLRPIM